MTVTNQINFVGQVFSGRGDKKCRPTDRRTWPTLKCVFCRLVGINFREQCPEDTHQDYLKENFGSRHFTLYSRIQFSLIISNFAFIYSLEVRHVCGRRLNNV